MRDAGAQDIRAITLGFDEFHGTPEDEAPVAKDVARHYGATHVVHRVAEQDFRKDLPSILDDMDQPSIDGVNTWYVAKAAKNAGLKVALSGLGGDELLGGYPSFSRLPRWRRRFGPAAAVPGLGRLSRWLLRAVAPALASRQPKALGMLEYASTWPGLYLLQRGLFMPHELNEIMNPDLVREGLRRLSPLDRLAATLVPDPGTDAGRVCVLELTQYMRNQLLRDADWAGMAHGVEIRVPLVDVALFKSTAPIFPVLAPGAGKAALASAPSRPLPQAVTAHAKTGFAVPTEAWIADAVRSRSALARPAPKGLVSRQWSRIVLSALTSSQAVPAL